MKDVNVLNVSAVFVSHVSRTQSRSGYQSVMITELSITTSYTTVERQRNNSRYFPLAVLTDAKGSVTLIASKSFLPFYAT